MCSRLHTAFYLTIGEGHLISCFDSTTNHFELVALAVHFSVEVILYAAENEFAVFYPTRFQLTFSRLSSVALPSGVSPTRTAPIFAIGL